MKKVMNTVGKKISQMALSVGKTTTNAACYGWFHQPQEPKSMTKFKKNA